MRNKIKTLSATDTETSSNTEEFHDALEGPGVDVDVDEALESGGDELDDAMARLTLMADNMSSSQRRKTTGNATDAETVKLTKTETLDDLSEKRLSNSTFYVETPQSTTQNDKTEKSKRVKKPGMSQFEPIPEDSCLDTKHKRPVPPVPEVRVRDEEDEQDYKPLAR